MENKKKFLWPALIGVVLGGGAWSTGAASEVISYPAPAMTVANCAGGYYWDRRENGMPYCKLFVPPPPPPPPPPPEPPAKMCRYEMWRYMIAVGPGGNCTADGGCDGYGYAVYDGVLSRPVAGHTWTVHEGYPVYNGAAMWPLVEAHMATTGYSMGAWKAVSPGNGNYEGTAMYEVCK